MRNVDILSEMWFTKHGVSPPEAQKLVIILCSLGFEESMRGAADEYPFTYFVRKQGLFFMRYWQQVELLGYIPLTYEEVIDNIKRMLNERDRSLQ